MFTLLLLALISSATAHKFDWGKCPKVDAMTDFDMEQFQGRWFVMKKMKTSISCLTDYFTSLPEAGTYNYTERQQIFDQIFLNEAVIKTDEGKLKVDYPLLIPDSSFKVIDTDYDTYAIIYKCQALIASRRWSMSILSRTLEMTKDTVDKLERQFNEKTSISTEHMSYIDHSDCIRDEDAMFTVGIGPGLSIKPGGQAIDSIADGFRGLTGEYNMDGSGDSKPSNNAAEEDFEFF